MAQSSYVSDKALFHLVPANAAAREALLHPDNKRFVSLSANNKLGLEIGFHVPPFSRGHVITRLGRNTDLILRESFSAVHVAFEVHPETLVVMLSVRTKRTSSVTVASEGRGEGGEPQQTISGDCAILYDTKYEINIASYEFELVWRKVDGPDKVKPLKDLTIQGYEDSMSRLKDVRSRDRSVLDSETPNSWYMTRLQSSKAPLVREIESSRVYVGGGAFGKVYRAIDATSGNYFAVKVVELKDDGDALKMEQERTALHREMKYLERISHHNIIECLGTADFHTQRPRIFMPLRDGSLHSLSLQHKVSHEVCNQAFAQMLSALDYLAFNKLCHRDVKPLNVLYRDLGQGNYHFQLADFGLANHWHHANTFCGTEFYRAPELYTSGRQSPVMDVWSLAVSIIQIHPECKFKPADCASRSPGDIVRAVQAKVWTSKSQLAPMVQIDPAQRATAAQMLVALFNGDGLTTPRNQIPPIPAAAQQLPSAPPVPIAQHPRRPAPPPVIVYPRRRHQQQQKPPRPAPTPGMLPNRIPQPNQNQQQAPFLQPLRPNRNAVEKRPAAQQAARPPPPPYTQQQQGQQGQQQQHSRLAQAMRAQGIEPRPVDRRPAEKTPGGVGGWQGSSVAGGVAASGPRVPGAFPE